MITKKDVSASSTKTNMQVTAIVFFSCLFALACLSFSYLNYKQLVISINKSCSEQAAFARHVKEQQASGIGFSDFFDHLKSDGRFREMTDAQLASYVGTLRTIWIADDTPRGISIKTLSQCINDRNV